MPPKPRKTRKKREQNLLPALKYLLETGDENQENFAQEDRYNEFVKFTGGVIPDIFDYWKNFGTEILAEWIKKNPCTRPWAFWAIDAGGNVFYCEIPAIVEQVKYLEKHGLLTEPEKKYLEKHMELMQPETVEYEQ
jgi:hypothetical protein